MKKLTKLQYEVIFLYSKGLTFKEIDIVLTTASRGVYSQVVAKDKGRVIRAKKSRETNVKSYKEELKIYIAETRKRNNYFKNDTQKVKEYYTMPLTRAKAYFRIKYINDSLDLANKSYSKYRLTFIKKHIEKAA
jgi:hypothetical protein